MKMACWLLEFFEATIKGFTRCASLGERFLGHYGNPNGSGFSLFLARANDSRRSDRCVDALMAECARPFVLFLTSMRLLSNRNESTLDARGCLIIPLDQAIAFDHDGNWHLSPWARDQYRTVKSGHAEPAFCSITHFVSKSSSQQHL